MVRETAFLFKAYFQFLGYQHGLPDCRVLQFPADNLGNRAALFDQGGELRRLQRLRPIAPRTFRTGMDFNNQTIRSGCDRR